MGTDMGAQARIDLPEPGTVPLDYEPRSEADWLYAISDPLWRICSGKLYKIITKNSDDDEGEVVPFKPNSAQLQFLEGLHNRNVILKARQLGFTTLISILWLDHALFVPSQRVGIIAHKIDDSEVIFRDKVRFAYDNMPELLRLIMPLKKATESTLIFAHNGSSIRVSTSMRSGTIHRLHVCLSGDTEIVLKDGVTKPIRDVQEGDLVMTDRGSYLPVQQLVKNRIEDVGEPMLSLNVHGWHEKLKLTSNHQIMTREFKTGRPVWKEAGEVEPGDYIAFPVREISCKLRDKCLPFGPQKVHFVNGKRKENEGSRIPVSRDLGILVGMYLAEGHRRRTEVTFALHRGEEVTWFRKLLEQFSQYYTSYRVDDCKTSLTTSVIVNGRGFAEFFASFFGDGIDKRIPDAVWGYGRQFVDGLIWGYFQGDGCFTNPREVQVTSIRPQLIHQMRMLLLSTRMGASSIYYRQAGVYYGRNCKETWVLKMHGAANWKFRDYFNLPMPEIGTKIGQIALHMPGNRNPISRKNWRRGKSHYWMRIKSVDIAPDEPYVYDLVLPKAPHSYVTTCGVVHNSELGKIAAESPKKAREIKTGSLPAVPDTGIAVVESTAEGKSGYFYEISTRAERRAQVARPLGRKEFRFHFFPWHAMPQYRAPEDDTTPISPTQHAYFDTVERQMGVKLDLRQRRWYVSTLEYEQAGDAESMWREYPSTPEECWQKSNAGTYYTPQLNRARAEGRIGPVPFVSHVPVHTFWDIGSGDGTAIWLMQRVGMQHRFPLFIEDWAQGYSHYVNKLRETGQVFGIHYLPHDAGHERQMQHRVGKPIDLLRELAPDWTFEIVPRVSDLQHGIQLTRDVFHTCWFDAEGCKEGIEHLESYHKKYSTRVQDWTDEPEKQDGHSEAADAFRQFAQGFDAGTAASNPYEALARIRRRAPTH